MDLLFVFALNIAFAFGANQHLICKTVDGVFTEEPSRGHSPAARHTLQGPPGKQGQIGVKGEPGNPGIKGEKGLTAVIDPRDVETVVEEKLREANRELRGRIDKLEQVVTRINASVADRLTTAYCEEGVVYREKCFYAIIPVSNINIQGARTLCAAEGGSLADILNFEHQRMAVDHIRSKTARYLNIWLGMTRTFSTKTLRWSNGVKVPEDITDSLKWRAWSSGSDKVVIDVDPYDFGFRNKPDNYYGQGALCQKRI